MRKMGQHDRRIGVGVQNDEWYDSMKQYPSRSNFMYEFVV